MANGISEIGRSFETFSASLMRELNRLTNELELQSKELSELKKRITILEQSQVPSSNITPPSYTSPSHTPPSYTPQSYIPPQEQKVFVEEEESKEDPHRDVVERPTIADVAQSKTPSWLVDIPGPKVEMVQSALSLNDRLIFVKELFEGDSEQFNYTLNRINETTSFDEVVSEMRDGYPDWDENSDIVYRFYMIVRRKFR